MRTIAYNVADATAAELQLCSRPGRLGHGAEVGGGVEQCVRRLELAGERLHGRLARRGLLFELVDHTCVL